MDVAGERETTVAYILLVVALGAEEDLVRKIREIPGVTEARIVYGEYDIVVRVETSSIRELDRVVSRIRGLPGILRTVTLIAATLS